jgi:hypothetical protein
MPMWHSSWTFLWRKTMKILRIASVLAEVGTILLQLYGINFTDWADCSVIVNDLAKILTREFRNTKCKCQPLYHEFMWVFDGIILKLVFRICQGKTVGLNWPRTEINAGLLKWVCWAFRLYNNRISWKACSGRSLYQAFRYIDSVEWNVRMIIYYARTRRKWRLSGLFRCSIPRWRMLREVMP